MKLGVYYYLHLAFQRIKQISFQHYIVKCQTSSPTKTQDYLYIQATYIKEVGWPLPQNQHVN